MTETVREAIVDWDWDNKLVSVVESIDEPWVYWVVILDAEGNDI